MSRSVALALVLTSVFAPFASAVPQDPPADESDVLTGNAAAQQALALKDWIVFQLSDALGVPPALANVTALAVVFIVVIAAFWIAGGLLAKLVGRAMTASRLKPAQLLLDFTTGAIQKATAAFGMLMALAIVGVPIGPVLAGIGVFGFVVGFALQETLSNFAAGMMILLYRPYDIGHAVTAGGVSGTVKSMSLVSTTISTADNQIQIVPNGAIWGGVITNSSANSTRRVDLVASVSYRDDVDQAQKLFERLVAEHPKVLKDPAPVVRLNKLGESSLDFVVRPWVKAEDYWTVYWDLTRSFKVEVERAGMSIPFPHRVLLMDRSDKAEKSDRPA
jgi:small conductance mechanosensitive channel